VNIADMIATKHCMEIYHCHKYVYVMS